MVDFSVLIFSPTGRFLYLKTHRIDGKTIGPRPELISEIVSEAKIKFYMYSADPFMVHAKKHLDLDIDSSAIDEVKNVRVRDEIQVRDFNQLSNFRNAVSSSIGSALLSSSVVEEYQSTFKNLMKEIQFGQIPESIRAITSGAAVNILPDISFFPRTMYEMSQATSSLLSSMLEDNPYLKTQFSINSNYPELEAKVDNQDDSLSEADAEGND